MTDDARRLLAGYATDSLTEAERQALLRAALDDQKIFEALVEEEGLRELLAAPAARETVLSVLERPGEKTPWLAWLRRPATLGDVMAVGAAVAVAVGGAQLYRATRPDTTTPFSSRPADRGIPRETLERLAALPPQATAPATLAFEGLPGTPRVRAGQALTVRVEVKTPARAVLLEIRPNGSVVQVWPAPRTPPALLTASVARRLRLVASSAAGRHRLRLVAAPLDVDLTASPFDDERAVPRLALVDLSYEMERP